LFFMGSSAFLRIPNARGAAAPRGRGIPDLHMAGIINAWRFRLDPRPDVDGRRKRSGGQEPPRPSQHERDQRADTPPISRILVREMAREQPLLGAKLDPEADRHDPDE